jgi:hypothetical protein
MRDPGRVVGDAAFKSILTPPVQPENRTKLAMVLPRKLDRQLRLAHSAEAMQNVYLLALALTWPWHQHPFKLGHLCWPVHKLARSRDAFKAEYGSIFAKVFTY